MRTLHIIWNIFIYAKSWTVKAVIKIFCREQERKCGTDGFLDSKKFTHTYEVAEKQTKRAGTPRPSSQNEIVKPLDSVSIVLKSEQEKKDYEKRIKVIEVSETIELFLFSGKRLTFFENLVNAIFIAKYID